MAEALQPPESEQPDGTPQGNIVPLDRHRRPDDPLLRTLLGGVLRQARHDQQRTLADVAHQAGVSVPYLSEIERGRKEPSSEMLAAVAGALDLDLLDLVSRTYVDLVGQRVHAVEVARPRQLGSGGGAPSSVLALAA